MRGLEADEENFHQKKNHPIQLSNKMHLTMIKSGAGYKLQNNEDQNLRRSKGKPNAQNWISHSLEQKSLDNEMQKEIATPIPLNAFQYYAWRCYIQCIPNLLDWFTSKMYEISWLYKRQVQRG